MFTKDNASEMGKKGGRANVEKNGREHMVEIGKKGFETTTNKYFLGSPALHKCWLREEGLYQYLHVLGELYGDKFQEMERPTHPARPDHTWF